MAIREAVRKDDGIVFGLTIGQTIGEAIGKAIGVAVASSKKGEGAISLKLSSPGLARIFSSNVGS